MKRIFVVALILSLGACASQPERTVVDRLEIEDSHSYTASADTQIARTSKKAYLDDDEVILGKSPSRRRHVVVIGGGKN